ncbi:putative Asparagine-rich antigen [Fasciola gigantica]|uniref:Centrosomal protein of 44 kDa n=1 Tax=Fasciola gigantica TaxID=46835 RepID=A0A504Z4V2_FASGI|nr:putative Asparagine-rich antigen [Fasciola gigantica]
MVDAKGYMEMLRRQLRALKFNEKLNYQGLILGDPLAYVTLYRRLLCDFNTELTQKLIDSGFSLLGTTDFRFMEVVYRILRDLLNLRPPITLNQFFTNGFIERKLEMASCIAARISTLIRRTVRKPRHFQSHSIRGPRSANVPGIVYRDLLIERAQSAGGRMMHNNDKPLIVEPPPTKQHKTSGEVESQPFADRLTKSISPTAGDEPRKKFHQNTTDYYDQLWEEKTVKRPPTFMTVDSHPAVIWGEESHNQAAIRSITPIQNTHNSPTVFYASLPNVAQSDQIKPRFATGSRSALGHTPYAKHGNQYHLLNSNPRPCSFSTLRKINMRRFRAWDDTSVNPPPSDKILAHVFPNEHILPTENTNPQADSTHEQAIREILRNLSQLNCKVDGLLTRLSALETRLPETATVENRPASVGKNRQNHLIPGKNVLEIATSLDNKRKHVSHSFDQSRMSPSQSSQHSSIIRPPLLQSMTIELQSPVREASEIGYSTVSSFSGALTELPILNSPTSNGTGRQTDTKQTMGTHLNNPHRFSVVHGTENLPRHKTSSATQNSPSKLIPPSSPVVTLAVPSSAEAHPTDNVPTEAVARTPSLRICNRSFDYYHLACQQVTTRCGDSLKSPASDLSKRTKWPPTPVTTASGREVFHRSSPSSSKQTEPVAHPTLSSYSAEPEPSVGTTLTAIPDINRYSEPYSSSLFGRADSFGSSEPTESANSFARLDDRETIKLTKPDIPQLTPPCTSESYQAQIDRITAMLAETQGFLESRRSGLLKGTT